MFIYFADSPTEAPAWIKPLLFQGQGVDQLEQKMDISEQATGKSNASGKKVEKGNKFTLYISFDFCFQIRGLLFSTHLGEGGGDQVSYTCPPCITC